MSTDNNQEFEVEQNLKEFRHETYSKFETAATNVRFTQAEADEDFNKATKENPEACVEFDAKDVHLLPVVLEELYTYFLINGLGDESVTQMIFEGGKKEFIRSRALHEGDHIQALIEKDKNIEGFGVFFCKKPNGHYDGIPYIKHETLDAETTRYVTLRPREFHSPGDLKIVEKLEKLVQ